MPLLHPYERYCCDSKLEIQRHEYLLTHRRGVTKEYEVRDRDDGAALLLILSSPNLVVEGLNNGENEAKALSYYCRDVWT